MKVLKLIAALVILLGLTAPAMAEEAKPAKTETEKAHVHQDGDGHDHGKDHEHKEGDSHDHGDKKAK